MSDLGSALEFLRRTESLKSTLRSGCTSSGRQESTAEHTWRLCLMIMVFAEEFSDIDILKLLKMCLIHDLGEAVGGDVSATMQDKLQSGEKSAQERRDLEFLTEPLPVPSRKEIMDLWEEYEASASPEAMLAKAFDKIETLLQHTQGLPTPEIDFDFNLNYGRQYTDAHPLTKAIRKIVDKDTKRRLGRTKNGCSAQDV